MQDCAFDYTRRQPETSVLYQVVAEQLETFLQKQEEHIGRPSGAKREARS